MSMTIYIGNDIASAAPAHIFKEEDFVQIIREQLGQDAERYVNSIIDERNNAIKERDDLIDEPTYEQGYSNGYAEGYDDGLSDGQGG